MGKPGFGWTTSSPRLTSAMIVKNMIGFAPGVTTTSSGVTGVPRVAVMCRAIAARSSGSPADGP